MDQKAREFSTVGYSAQCLSANLARAVAFKPKLERLREIVNEPGNLSMLQGLQFYAVCRDFRPDLIVEVGRGYGNSTCVFASAVTDTGYGRFLSFDLDRYWHDLTIAPLRASPFAHLLRVVDARIEDVAGVDFVRLLDQAKAVLVFWDAHGWAAADGVLCRLLPAIADRRHLVLCHDMSDSRYVEVPRDYGGRMFWRGNETKEVSARYNVGWLNTQEPQFIPLMDFLWRNDCPMHSADEDLVTWRSLNRDRQGEIEAALGPELFAPGCHWGYFSLNEAPRDLKFPRQP